LGAFAIVALRRGGDTLNPALPVQYVGRLSCDMQTRNHSTTPPRRVRSTIVALAAALLVSGCDRSPIMWTEGEASQVALSPADTAQSARDAAVSRAARAAVGESVADARDDSSLDSVPLGIAEGERVCAGSLRMAPRPGTREHHAVWWSLRPDSSVALRAARSDDGGATWGRHVPVDSLDHGGIGCDRPAPAITVDSTTGYIHVAYHLTGPEGPGVFFSHSMEHGALFHSPMVIVYGERPAPVAIASSGDTIAVAYLDPNSGARPRVAVAISRTSGHLFDPERVLVSSSGVATERPAVALRGSAIAVAWIEGGRVRVKTGRVK
jgi:hypothetical protein